VQTVVCSGYFPRKISARAMRIEQFRSFTQGNSVNADKKFKHVSNCCMDFMKRLLVRDPRYRMSTGEALLHPFITGASFMPRYNGMSAAPAGPRSGNDMEVDGGSALKLTSDQLGVILER